MAIGQTQEKGDTALRQRVVGRGVHTRSQGAGISPATKMVNQGQVVKGSKYEPGSYKISLQKMGPKKVLTKEGG